MAIAAGSGITPVIAIARTVLAAHPETRFDLVYANKAAMDVMFLEELADLKDKYPTRLALHHVLSREQRIAPLLSGRIDAEKLQACWAPPSTPTTSTNGSSAARSNWSSCAATPWPSAASTPEHVRFELFTTGKPDRPEGNIGRPVVADESQDNYKITFKLDGLQGEVASPTHARESDPQRGPAGPPGRAVRLRRRRLRHLPRQGGHRHRHDGRELRAGAGRAGQGLRPDLPVPPHHAEKSPSTSTSSTATLWLTSGDRTSRPPPTEGAP